jgi:trypsin-like peptidase
MKIQPQRANVLARSARIRTAKPIFAVLLVLAALAGAVAENINTGSGFLIAPNGYILTNYHVVANAQRVGVVLHNGARHEANIIALDEYKDLALLKIDGSDFPNAAIGSSQKTEVMEHVMLLGFPLVDSVGTEVSMSDGRINSIRQGSRIPLFQIDANLNAGGSGGPLVNDKGEVVGIAVAKLSALPFMEEAGTFPERINFAIPIDEARYLVQKAYPFGLPQIERSARAPQEIYAELKKATVFLVAVGSSEATDSSQSTQQSSQQSGASLASFVEAFLAAGQSNFDPLSELSFYADTVDYFDNGVVNRAFIMNDIQEYAKRWPWRRFWIDGEIRTRTINQRQGIAEATFRLNFEVQNPKKTVTGSCDDFLLIKTVRSRPEIVAIKSKLVKRNELTRR